jgi:hypothetical protein
MFDSMIPYDDLVAALSQWRARQGLPVNSLGGSGSGGTKTAGSGPNKAPPPAPGAHHDEEVMEAEEYDGAYEQHDGEPTQHGTAPERPTDSDMRGGGGGGGGRDDW